MDDKALYDDALDEKSILALLEEKRKILERYVEKMKSELEKDERKLDQDNLLNLSGQLDDIIVSYYKK